MRLADLFGRQRSATTAHHRLQVLLMHEREEALASTVRASSDRLGSALGHVLDTPDLLYSAGASRSL